MRITIPHRFTAGGREAVWDGWMDDFERPDGDLTHTAVPTLPYQYFVDGMESGGYGKGVVINNILGGEGGIRAFPTLGHTFAVVDSGMSDGKIACTLGSPSSSGGWRGIGFRHSGAATRGWAFAIDNSGGWVLRYLGPDEPRGSLASGSKSGGGAGIRLTVEFRGPLITGWVNDNQVVQIEDSRYQEARLHGIYNNGGTSNTLRDITVRA